MSARPPDPWVRVPAWLVDLLERGEIAFDAFGLMVWPARKAWPTGECTVPSLQTILDHTHMAGSNGRPRTKQHAWDMLNQLVNKGLIETDVEERKRPWVIRIVDRVGFGYEKRGACQQNPPPVLTDLVNGSPAVDSVSPISNSDRRGRSLSTAFPTEQQAEQRREEAQQQAEPLPPIDLDEVSELLPACELGALAGIQRDLRELPAVDAREAVADLKFAFAQGDANGEPVKNRARYARAALQRRVDDHRREKRDPEYHSSDERLAPKWQSRVLEDCVRCGNQRNLNQDGLCEECWRLAQESAA